MFKFRKYFLAAFLASVSMVSHAGTAGWSTFGEVSQLNQNPGVSPGGDLIFFRIIGSTNPSGCSLTDGFYLNVVNDREKRVFALLMAAQAAGKSVQVYVTGVCFSWGNAEIEGITVQ